MDREKLIAKIKALKAKTPGNGCTEAEALAAAEKAAALMAEHSLSEERLEVRDQSTDVKSTFKAARSRIWGYVAHATNCSVVHLAEGQEYRVVFVGCEPGPEIACYLRDVCDRAIDRAIADFKLSPPYKSRRATSTRRKAVEDFTVAMVDRLGRRLADLFVESRSGEKRELARQVRDEMFPNGREVKQRDHKPRFWQASASGAAAGDRVHLARGVKDGNGAVALIGGGK